MTAKLYPSEHVEQVHFVQWLTIRKLRFNATPNGEKRAISTAKRLKAEGVSAGYPDINVYTSSKMLCIELKKQKGGSVSPKQKEWLEALNSLPYCEARVCKGWNEARLFVEEYL